MTLEIERIYLSEPNPLNSFVTYENKLQPKMTFGSNEIEKFYRDHEDTILIAVEKEIRNYVNTDNLCNDDDMFPRRSLLTGEWYLREIYFEDKNYLSVSTAFLGTGLGYKDDYLGLEVTLQYDELSKIFMIIGVDSASI